MSIKTSQNRSVRKWTVRSVAFGVGVAFGTASPFIIALIAKATGNTALSTLPSWAVALIVISSALAFGFTFLGLSHFITKKVDDKNYDKLGNLKMKSLLGITENVSKEQLKEQEKHAKEQQKRLAREQFMKRKSYEATKKLEALEKKV